MKHGGTVLGCVALLACGSEPVETAALGEVCGAPSPVRVLPLADEEVVRAFETLQVGERVVYVVGRIDPADPDAPFPDLAPTTVWSAGPCGEAPVQLATGVDEIFKVEAWPEVVLGCEKATGDVLVLDPTGARAAQVVFSPGLQSGILCGVGWTDFGLVSLEPHDETRAALRLHRFAADPWAGVAAPEVLVDPVDTAAGITTGRGFVSSKLYTFPDHLFALSGAGELVRVELADGAVTTVQAGVAAFEATEDAAYVIWQDAAVTGGDALYPTGKVFLRIGPGGEDVLLGESALRRAGLALRNAERGVLEYQPGASDAKRLFSLPSLEFVDVTTDLWLGSRLADGRWIVGSRANNLKDLLDLRSGERTPLFPREADVVGLEDDAVRVLERPQCCSDGEDYRDEGPLWRVPLAGAEPTLLADRATRTTQMLPDGRLLGPLDTGASWLGSLMIVDPASRAESRIDDRVYYHSVDTTRMGDEGIVRYSVADGERSGVYVAKLPAQPR